MPAYKNVALAGANGNLGPSILQALIDAGTFTITLLSQSGKAPSSLPQSVKVLKVDYTSPESLVSALKGQQVLISLLPDFGRQPALIDAAIDAGVQRFIPSEFGSDTQHEKVRGLPVFQGKLETQEYLRSKEKEISWSIIVNGLFFDWGIQVGFWANLKDEGVTSVYDNGDARHRTTLLSDVGKSVVGVLNNPSETKNRVLYVQSTSISQNKILEIARKKNPELKLEVKNLRTEDILQGALKKFGKGPGAGAEFGEGIMGLLTVSIFNEGYGNEWSGRNDNALLGIKELSEEGAEEVVGRFVVKDGTGAGGADGKWLEKKLEKA